MIANLLILCYNIVLIKMWGVAKLFYLYKDHAGEYYFTDTPNKLLYCNRDGLSDKFIGASSDPEDLIVNIIVPLIVSQSVNKQEIYNNWPFEGYKFEQDKYSSARTYIGLNLMVAKRINLKRKLMDKVLYLSDSQATAIINDLGLELEASSVEDNHR